MKRQAARCVGLLVLLVAVGVFGCKKEAPAPAPTPPSEPAAAPAGPEAAPVEGSPGKALAEEQEVIIWWAQWDPSDGLQNVGNEFEKRTGIAVHVHQIPWPSYQDQVTMNFGGKQTNFDIVIGDSQWLGWGATKEFYVDLTNWLKENVDVSAIHPLSLRYLCEYPTGSGNYFAAPCEIDATGFTYRKDWFEDPEEQAAFAAEYGRPLTIPDTWEELRDLAEFFNRPDEKRYGCVLLTGRGYDSLIMGFQQIMWAYGGDWGNRETYEVDGYLNSAGSAEALAFMKELLGFAPPGATNFDWSKCLEAFNNGSTAMQMNYFTFYPSICRVMGDKVGFFIMPRKGERRFASLGGQGFSISKKIPEARQERAKKFIAWFLSEEGQQLWIRQEAGFTSNVALLKSEAFKVATPYNPAFAESLDHLKDFWNIPVYGELMTTAVKRIAEAIDGECSPQEALDTLTAEHEAILRDGGFLK